MKTDIRSLSLVLLLMILGGCPWPFDLPFRETTPDAASTGPAQDWDNPGRGYFGWRGLSVVPGPSGHQDRDQYQRYWWYDPDKPENSLELASSTPESPAYNFTPLLQEYRKVPPGGSFSFRIRSLYNYAPGTDLQPGPGYGKPKAYVPRYLLSSGFYADSDGSGTQDVFIPDWNSEAYLSGVERLLSALVTTLDREIPDWRLRTGFVDLGLYGQYGEWYQASWLDPSGDKYSRLSPELKALTPLRSSPPPRPYIDYDRPEARDFLPLAAFRPTADNPRKRLADAHLRAFSDVRTLMFFLYDQAELLDYLFHTQTLTALPVGVRIDGLGRPGFLYRQWENSPEKLGWWNGTRWGEADSLLAQTKAFKNRWKTAPFVAEFVGSDTVTEGDEDHAGNQVLKYHISQVSNGNFTAAPGSSEAQWSSVAPGRRSALYRIGNTAGFRLEIIMARLSRPAAGTDSWTWEITVKNAGSSPFYESLSVQWKLQSGEGERILREDDSLGKEIAALPPGEERTFRGSFLPAGLPEKGLWTAIGTLTARGIPWVPSAGAGDIWDLGSFSFP